MALKTFKPYTKSTRGTVVVDKSTLWKGSPYKALTRGQNITADSLEKFIAELNIPEEARSRLKALTPSDYVGLAAELARNV